MKIFVLVLLSLILYDQAFGQMFWTLPVEVQQREYQRLYTDLFDNYNKNFKPQGSVNVQFVFDLIQIVNVLEKDQVIVVHGSINHYWNDYRLKWDPANYSGIGNIQIPFDKIWTPDTMVLTTSDASGLLTPQNGINFVLLYDGSIFWTMTLNQMKSRCKIEITYFPFDVQTCYISFGSTVNTDGGLDYTIYSQANFIYNYSENKQWSLVSKSAIKLKELRVYNHYAVVRYKFIIKRKPLFIITNCVIPALILSGITIVTFFIPFAQAISLGITIILAYSVLSIRLNDNIPAQADTVPLLVLYFIICMCLTLAAMTYFTCLNQMKEKKFIPRFIKWFSVYFLTLIFSENRKEIIKSYENLYTPKPKLNKVAGALEQIEMRNHREQKEINESILLKVKLLLLRINFISFS